MSLYRSKGSWLAFGVLAVAFVGYLFFDTLVDGVRTAASGEGGLAFVAAHWGLWLAGVIIGGLIALAALLYGASGLLSGGRGSGVDPRSAASGFKLGVGIAVLSAVPLVVSVVSLFIR